VSASHEQPHAMGHPTFKQYALIAIILFVITIVEFLLIYDRAGIDDRLGGSKIPLLIVLSAVKFAIVIMFYMHLKFEIRLLSGIFLAGLGLAFAAGIALIFLFVGFGAEPRDFAEANAVPYVEHEAEAESESTAPAGPVVVQIGVVGDTLAFDADHFTASAGSEVVLTFNNGSGVNQHNWVLVQAGTKDDVAAAGLAAGADNGWIPQGDARVLAQTSLLDPGGSEEIRFTLEAGTYQFVCTFPGHNLSMFGEFEVQEPEATASVVPVVVQIGVVGDTLAFDADHFTASAGSEVVLTFNNRSGVNQHNWVLVQAGTKDDVAAAGLAAGADNGWIPQGDARVLAHTSLLGPGGSEEIRFTLEAGTYQFVCTFPGHNLSMFGDFVVTP